MPFDGAGTYSPPAADFPAVTLTTISSTHFNNTLNDVATGLSTCITKDGQTTPTANLKLGGFYWTLGGYRAINGSVGTPSISFDNDTDCGLYRIGANNIGFAVNGAKVIDISTTGITVTSNIVSTGAVSGTGFSGTTADFTGLVNAPNYLPLSKGIYGLTYANAAGDVTNDLDIAAGGAMASTGDHFMNITAMTKQSDAAWVAGTGAGALDTGSVGNSDYYIWLIGIAGSTTRDFLFSLSSTAPTMPGSYDRKRLVGWFKRSGAAIVLFHTYELEGGGLGFTWDSPSLDVDLANTLTTARRTDAVKVPLNVSTIARLNVAVRDDTAAVLVRVCCPDQTDVAVASNTGPMANIFGFGSGAIQVSQQIRVRTSAAGLIAARADTATVDIYRVSTEGFDWARRN